ncbi:hypothetical protein BGZ76_000683, partial [Entomortierella beljakovae]
MGLLIHYPSTKSFDWKYSAIIYLGMLVGLVGIGVWTFRTKLDCEPFTSDVYNNQSCIPFNLANNTEVQILNFPVTNTISGLSEDYSYTGRIFTCLDMDNYRIVQHASRYVEVYYNAMCYFNDEFTTSFNLTANTATNQLEFGWYADLPGAICLERTESHMLESMIFDSYDNGVVAIGNNIDGDCTLGVALDPVTKKPKPNRRGDPIENVTSFTLGEYSDFQKGEARRLLSGKSPMTFSVGYSCRKCSSNSILGFALALATTLSSVGTLVFKSLVWCALQRYENRSKGSKHDHMALNNLHSGYSEIIGEREYGGSAHAV